MRYVSVCSGIEAASVAWHPLGWQPLLFAEIAAFPSKVLAHHYPEVPNVGDFTTIDSRAGCDLLVGGTPCQSFSIAGLRGGLCDARGNLALEFMRLTDRLRPRWVLWENVPGVLSSNGGRDFGSILGALAELGYGFAWRVLDAQFFGVPQRRRRVFLVGSLGGWRAAQAVLFERESMRRDPASRRAQGEGVAAPLGGGAPGRGRCSDVERMTFVPKVGGTLRRVQTNTDDPWNGRTWIASNAEGSSGLPFLTKSNVGKGVNNQTPLIAFDPTQVTSPENRSSARGDTAGALAKTARPPHIAFNARQDPIFGECCGPLDTDGGTNAVCVTGEVTHALRAIGSDAREDGTGRGTPITTPDAWSVRRLTPRECERLQGFPDDYTAIPGAKDGPRYAALGNSMAVPVMRWIGRRIALVDEVTR